MVIDLLHAVWMLQLWIKLISPHTKWTLQICRVHDMTDLRTQWISRLGWLWTERLSSPKWDTHSANRQRVCTCAFALTPKNSPDLDLLWSSFLSSPPLSASPAVLLRFRLSTKQWSSLLASGSPWPLTSHPSYLPEAGLKVRLNSDDNKLELKVWDREKHGRRG